MAKDREELLDEFQALAYKVRELERRIEDLEEKIQEGSS